MQSFAIGSLWPSQDFSESRTIQVAAQDLSFEIYIVPIERLLCLVKLNPVEALGPLQGFDRLRLTNDRSNASLLPSARRGDDDTVTRVESLHGWTS
jgi:hypothetical protein